MLRKLAAIVFLMSAFVVGGVFAHIAILSADLPDLSSMADYKPPVTSRVYDTDGNLVARFYEERRTVVPITQVPKHVKNAFIAAEDADFYKHKGIDYLAIIRCSLMQVRAKVVGGSVCGGSTITQQTAQTFLLSMEHNYSNKVKKFLLANKIEEQFQKDEILHLYLNQIYFGNGAYGIEEAAHTYYGVSVDKLTLGQAAALASIPKSPNRINPFADPKRVRARRAYVLGQMDKNGMITAAEKARAEDEPVAKAVEPPEFLDVAPYYAEAVRQMLITHKDIGEDEVLRGGLTVYAALDAKLQKAANVAVAQGLRDLDKRQGYRGPSVRLDPDEAKALLTRLDAEKERRFPKGEVPGADSDALEKRTLWDLSDVTAAVAQKAATQTVHNSADDDEPEEAGSDKPTASLPPIAGIKNVRAKSGVIVGGVVKKVDATDKSATIDLGTHDARLPFSAMVWARPFDPEKATEKPKTPGDVLRRGDVVLVKLERVVTPDKKKPMATVWPAHWEVSLEQDPKVEGALTAVDPASHRVLALVGGYDFSRSSFNRATQARRQPGSAFKPFVYATGIETKLFSPVGYFDADTRGQRLITDAPKVFYDKWTKQPWKPDNSNSRFLGDITLRTCLTHSVNTCSISILERTGIEPVRELAKKLNLSDDAHPLPENLTLALGTGEVIPLDLINAYAIFPGEGRHAPPLLIDKVKRRDGVVITFPRAEAQQVISPQTASVMSHMMKSVVESGTATRARDLGRPVAGKTGTTSQARSVWFVGFTPELVAGVYVGFDDNTPLGRNESGGRAAVPIWLSFMKAATEGTPPRDFPIADGVVTRSVDVHTGLLARIDGAAAGALPEPAFTEDGDPIPKELPQGVISEVFVSGTEPLLSADDAPPPPLEMMEQGGLGP